MASDTSSTNRTVLFADPPGSSNYVYAEVPTSALNKEMMDVAFVKVVDSFNFPGGISALLRDHRFDEGGVNLGDHWKHKYLVDVDGMGYSGRFFSFLESDSVVLKATVYREFYEQWLEPWYEFSHPATCSSSSHDVFRTGYTTSRFLPHTKKSTTYTPFSPVQLSLPSVRPTPQHCRNLLPGDDRWTEIGVYGALLARASSGNARWGGEWIWKV